MSLARVLTRDCILRAAPCLPKYLPKSSLVRYNSGTSSLTNMLASDTPPPVQVESLTPDHGLTLADGLVIPGACIFLEGKVFLWDVNLSTESGGWTPWRKECFEIFDVVKPRPDILILGTGQNISVPPPFVRSYLQSLGIQLDVMNTRNACTTYNMLAEEGRRVAAALLPLKSTPWQKTEMGPRS